MTFCRLVCRPTIGGTGSDGQAPSSPAAGGGSKAPADDIAPVTSVEASVLHSRPPPPATLEPAAAAGVTKLVPFASQLAKPRLVEVQRREGESLGINIVGEWCLPKLCLWSESMIVKASKLRS